LIECGESPLSVFHFYLFQLLLDLSVHLLLTYQPLLLWQPSVCVVRAECVSVVRTSDYSSSAAAVSCAAAVVKSGIATSACSAMMQKQHWLLATASQ
jgi:hypothetical protein